eukprot:3625616-Amphidinium_carterae.1
MLDDVLVLDDVVVLDEADDVDDVLVVVVLVDVNLLCLWIWSYWLSAARGGSNPKEEAPQGRPGSPTKVPGVCVCLHISAVQAAARSFCTFFTGLR